MPKLAVNLSRLFEKTTSASGRYLADVDAAGTGDQLAVNFASIFESVFIRGGERNHRDPSSRIVSMSYLKGLARKTHQICLQWRLNSC